MPFSRLQILVIEDDSSTNETLVRLFQRTDHDATSAKDGEVALEMLKMQRFDLVISDIGLPGTYGWDLLKRLRK